MSQQTLIQRGALTAWTTNNHVGTVVLPTGVGKTRLGVMASTEVSALFERRIKVLVITSRVPILAQWKKEFENVSDDMDVEYLCINSAFKRTSSYDLVIVDEIHRSLSLVFRGLYDNVRFSKIIGLTATKPHNHEHLQFLETVCPIVFERNLNDVIEEGILPSVRIFNVSVPLAKSIGSKYKAFNANFDASVIELMRHRQSSPVLFNRYKSAFEMANALKSLENDSPTRRSARKFWASMSMRKNVLYSNPAKIEKVLAILLANPNRKWIIFTKTISMAEELAKRILPSALYHSKLSKDVRKEVLDNFERQPYGVMVAVDALNEGLNITTIDSAICVSGVSTLLTNYQQLGRILRRAPDKKPPVFFNLFTQDTVEKTWVEKKTKDLNNVKWLLTESDLKVF